MATISSKFQYVWYGTCESERCDDVLFDNWYEMKDELESAVVEISTYEEGEFKSYSPSVANSTSSSSDDKPNTLLGLRCGHMYLFTLKTNKSITIPNTYVSGPLSKVLKYGASETCSTISDADLLGCGGQDYTTFYMNDAVVGNWTQPDGTESVSSHKTAIYTNVAGEIFPEKLTSFDDKPSDESYTLLTELIWYQSNASDQNSYISIKLDDYEKTASASTTPASTTSPINVVNLTLNGKTIAWFTINGGITESTQIYYFENASCYRGKISPDDFIPDDENQFAGRVNVLLGTEQAIHTWPELCTFRDPNEDAESETAITFDAFNVSSSPNENNTRSDIELSQFVWKGVLQLPPEQTGTDAVILENPKVITVKSESGAELGRVKYLRHEPVKINDKVFMYFYVESGPLDGNCLFGVVNGDECILRGVN